MSFKDILLHLDLPSAAGPALAAGVSLAQSHGAHLTGLYAYDLAWPLYGVAGDYMDGPTIQRLMEEAASAARKQSGELKARFEEELRRESLPGEWRQIDGSVEATLALHSRYADLSIFARPPEDDLESNLAKTVLFASGRPILVLPPVTPRPFAVDRILIGWGGTRESARAVADAMPLLRRAKAVQVLTIATGDEGDRDCRINAEDLARHLTRHGVEVVAETTVAGTLSVEEVLLNTAAESGADLLVIGGYGHGRLREMVLGGVTRQLLRHAPLPVFLSH